LFYYFCRKRFDCYQRTQQHGSCRRFKAERRFIRQQRGIARFSKNVAPFITSDTNERNVEHNVTTFITNDTNERDVERDVTPFIAIDTVERDVTTFIATKDIDERDAERDVTRFIATKDTDERDADEICGSHHLVGTSVGPAVQRSNHRHRYDGVSTSGRSSFGEK
jgi:hypothetical protein